MLLTKTTLVHFYFKLFLFYHILAFLRFGVLHWNFTVMFSDISLSSNIFVIKNGYLPLSSHFRNRFDVFVGGFFDNWKRMAKRYQLKLCGRHNEGEFC